MIYRMIILPRLVFKGQVTYIALDEIHSFLGECCLILEGQGLHRIEKRCQPECIHSSRTALIRIVLKLAVQVL